MNNKAMMSALLVIGLVGPERKASCNGKSILGFDALQFRAPYSLGELLHDGLVAVEVKVQEVISDANMIMPVLGTTSLILEDLHNQYHMMVDRSNMHTMQRDDRDFLQNMIDRIDHMIKNLEGSRSYLENEHSLIQKNSDLLSDLKAKLAT